jgi:hypothetical protein
MEMQVGLYISHLDTVTIKGERSLYIYLLDYGWPEGQWEQRFKRHFMRMAEKAAETGAVVIGSTRGIHFANEVFSFHNVNGHKAEEVLPGLLVTKTHPSYFKESFDGDSGAEPGLDTLLLIPLNGFCTNEDHFIGSIEQLFSDLKSGAELKNYTIAQHDLRKKQSYAPTRRMVDSIEVKPGVFGISVDVRKLLGL